jgi:hypothetical protein
MQILHECVTRGDDPGWAQSFESTQGAQPGFGFAVVGQHARAIVE